MNIYKKYRQCVGAMIVNKNHKKIFVAERIDSPGSFQMPQGGINKDEESRAAILREIEEETGMKKLEFLSCMENPIEYTIPNNYLPKKWNDEFIGQSILFFLLRFDGDDNEINLNNSPNPEFQSWKWIDIEELTNHTLPFKKNLYFEVCETFKPIISIIFNDYKILENEFL
jgi:putative (di)nucleoside polyphosphate hydrolase